MSNADSTPIRAPLCPICGKLRAEAFKPFCSKHCADLDLSRWLKGIYAVPARDEDESDGRRPETDPGESRY